MAEHNKAPEGAGYRVGEFIGRQPVLCPHGSTDPNNLCAYCEGDEVWPGRAQPQSEQGEASGEALDEGAAGERDKRAKWIEDARDFSERMISQPAACEIIDRLLTIIESYPSPTPAAVPAEVQKLVIAARLVAYEDKSPDAIKELDAAVEAFADRVPWDHDPNDEGVEP